MSETVPKLRFKNLVNQWEVKYLGDYMSFKNGINADKSQYGHGEKYISVLDIIAPKPITHKSILGLVNVSTEILEKNKVIYGDILFQRSSEIREEAGQSNVYLDKSKPATFGGFVIRGRSTTEFDPIFFNYLLKIDSARKEITNRAGGSTRFNIGQESLSEVPIYVTEDISEQQKIASFLSAVDEKIGHLERRLTLLQTYKRGVMHKLLSQEVRFEEFEGLEWKEVELSHIIQDFIVPMRDKPKAFNGTIPWCRIEDFNGAYLSDSKSGQYVDEQTVREMKLKLNPVGTLLVSCSANLGVCAIVTRPLITNQTFIGLVPDEKQLDVKFLYYVMSSKAHALNRLSSGTTISYLAREQFERFKVYVPSLSEQRKIAAFLSAIDTKLDAVSTQTSQMQRFKKGLLQQMFV